MQTEDEIQTLRQVLNAKIKHSNDIKRKLGISVWKEFSEDITQGIKTIQETTAYVFHSSAYIQSVGIRMIRVGSSSNYPNHAFSFFAYLCVLFALAKQTVHDPNFTHETQLWDGHAFCSFVRVTLSKLLHAVSISLNLKTVIV